MQRNWGSIKPQECEKLFLSLTFNGEVLAVWYLRVNYDIPILGLEIQSTVLGCSA